MNRLHTQQTINRSTTNNYRRYHNKAGPKKRPNFFYIFCILRFFFYIPQVSCTHVSKSNWFKSIINSEVRFNKSESIKIVIFFRHFVAFENYFPSLKSTMVAMSNSICPIARDRKLCIIEHQIMLFDWNQSTKIITCKKRENKNRNY